MEWHCTIPKVAISRSRWPQFAVGLSITVSTPGEKEIVSFEEFLAFSCTFIMPVSTKHWIVLCRMTWSSAMHTCWRDTTSCVLPESVYKTCEELCFRWSPWWSSIDLNTKPYTGSRQRLHENSVAYSYDRLVQSLKCNLWDWIRRSQLQPRGGGGGGQCSEAGSLTSLMHVTQVHPVVPQKQFHCTRLYTSDFHTSSGTERPQVGKMFLIPPLSRFRLWLND